MTDGTGSPVSDATWAIFKEVGGSTATFSLEVYPEKVRLITKQISSDMVPFAFTGTIYDGINNSLLVNGSYEASGENSFAAGYMSRATGSNSAAFNFGTQATGEDQLAVGRFNKVDKNALFIVGNGGNDVTRSTAFSVGASSTNINTDVNISEGHNLVANNIILTSPNGTKYRITVNDEGTLTSTKVN